jgi:hypothetical protein
MGSSSLGVTQGFVAVDVSAFYPRGSASAFGAPAKRYLNGKLKWLCDRDVAFRCGSV